VADYNGDYLMHRFYRRAIMAATNGNFTENIENVLQELHAYLHSKMLISESEEDSIGITIGVRNDAPVHKDGGQVVFTGVGLHIIDGSEKADSHLRWTRNISLSRPTNLMGVRQSYQQGVWVSGEQFTALTDNEQSFGETLFPGESVVYETKIPKDYLHYTEIKVEGTISQRHLFHISRTIPGLEKWTRPALVKAFKALSAVGIQYPIQIAIEAMPDFGGKTTLEEINTFKGVVKDAKSLIQPIMKVLNEVFHSAPNQELRDHMKKNVGHYLTSLEKTFRSTLDALSSGNAEQMRKAAESLNERLVASEEVNKKTSELMARYGVSPGELK